MHQHPDRHPAVVCVLVVHIVRRARHLPEESHVGRARPILRHGIVLPGVQHQPRCHQGITLCLKQVMLTGGHPKRLVLLDSYAPMVCEALCLVSMNLAQHPGQSMRSNPLVKLLAQL